MIWVQQLGVGGKASWVTDLMVAAEHHQPVAYVAFFICLIVLCIFMILVACEYKGRHHGHSTPGSLARLTVQGLGVLSVPAFFLYCLGSRLFG